MNDMTPPKFGRKIGIGSALRRKEDPAFITGRGRYTGDVKREGLLHGYVMRSPYAAATFAIVDVEAAKAAPGVHLVLTGADVAGYGKVRSRTIPPKNADGSKTNEHAIPLLCDGEVFHVGDAVAFIVAENEEQARRASELIEIDWSPREAVVDTEEAVTSATLVHPEQGSNVSFTVDKGKIDETKAAFEGADHVTELKLVNNRLVCNYMETRSALGEWSDEEDRWTLTVGSQGVHGIRRGLAEEVFDMPAEKFRVVTHDVGGGFGTKAVPYREYPLTLIAAKATGHPVRWTGDRSEHFVSCAHGRDNVTTMRMAMDADGRFLALDCDLIAGMGAYDHCFGAYVPQLGMTIATGVYDIPAARFRVTGVYTNTVPTDAYRGAGRPEAIYALERLVDVCADEMGLAPDEIRRRNFIAPSAFPYTTPFDRTYDVGEFAGHLEKAMEQADWAGFDARRAEAAERGKLRGIGLSTYVEACAFAGSEPAHLKLNEDGGVTIAIGTQSNGQGHVTAYTQFATEALGLDPDRIEVRQGDTDELEKGGGTGGSRSIPLGGVSVERGAKVLAEKIRKIAADRMEASVGDIELVDGNARILGTDRQMTLAEIAAASDEPLEGVGEFKQAEATYPNGTHVCELEVTPETGETEIVGYTIVDDYGTVVNPLLLAGQVHGGVVQAIGQCLMEKTVYDEDGQLISASFMDYRMPRAEDIPNFSFDMRNVPSTTNALGIKGAGEAGTIGGCPAVMNALVDALKPATGIRHIDMPATPETVWALLNASVAKAA